MNSNKGTTFKKTNIFTKIFILLFSVLFIFVGYEIFFPVPLVNNNYSLVISKGDSVKSIINNLYEHKIIRDKYMLRILLRISHKDTKIYPGLYFLKQSISLLKLFYKITSGNPDQIAIVIVPGWNIIQLRAYVDGLQKIQHLTKSLTEEQLRQNLKITFDNLEGAFYPTTYFMAPNQTDLEFYETAYRFMEKKLEALYLNRNKFSHYKNRYELLIMASLIQKETNDKQDMIYVSTVFNNRINNGMKLQDDPAVFYGLHNKSEISHKDFLIDTKYNTYLHAGFPVSPICIPSENALIAASNPENNPKLLYFIADGKGKTKFSETFEQHKKNIIKFLKKNRKKTSRSGKIFKD